MTDITPPNPTNRVVATGSADVLMIPEPKSQEKRLFSNFSFNTECLPHHFEGTSTRSGRTRDGSAHLVRTTVYSGRPIRGLAQSTQEEGKALAHCAMGVVEGFSSKRADQVVLGSSLKVKDRNRNTLQSLRVEKYCHTSGHEYPCLLYMGPMVPETPESSDAQVQPLDPDTFTLSGTYRMSSANGNRTITLNTEVEYTIEDEE